MIQTILSQIGWFLLLITLQVFAFNHIHFAGFATPLPYVYFLLTMTSEAPRWVYIVIGFALGLIMDLFTNTPGMAAASLCTVGLVVPLLFGAFAPKDKDKDTRRPSCHSMEWSGFTKYAFFATLLHCTCYFSIDAFSFFRWQHLLLNIVGSTITTLLCIVGFEMIRSKASHR